MSKRNLHVAKHQEGGWKVQREKADKASSIHKTQSDAIDQAQRTGKREKVEVVIHDRQGRIRDKDSYGNDPNPPKDTKH